MSPLKNRILTLGSCTTLEDFTAWSLIVFLSPNEFWIIWEIKQTDGDQNINFITDQLPYAALAVSLYLAPELDLSTQAVLKDDLHLRQPCMGVVPVEATDMEERRYVLPASVAPQEEGRDEGPS